MIACTEHRIVVVGNAGIGKSYMQLVILVWWARPELRPVLENVDDGAALDKFLDGIEAIARVERDSWTDLFFKREQLHYGVETLPLPSLRRLDSKSTLLLYEPWVSQNEIQLSGITRGHVWVTVSPLEQRYKEFSKIDAAVKYVKCADEAELVFMAAVLEKGIVRSDLKPLYEASLVLERIRTRGPFLPVFLPTSKNILTIETKSVCLRIGCANVDKQKRVWFISEEGTSCGMPISHRLLRISPNVEDKYASYTLKLASNLAVERLVEVLLATDVMELKDLLQVYNADPRTFKLSPAIKGAIPMILEAFFVQYAVTIDKPLR
ncbi:hypothetical protein B5M09_010138 [Aphanomyces astaci]|uniref:Uncharacterized protein n=1 Tax=Aphanomyces astaci TaxID=112090 RepID=A0A425CTZ8_APHAT|nr:hypothetical protein B5M09_010138 [Aphanomyces astaci]